MKLTSRARRERRGYRRRMRNARPFNFLEFGAAFAGVVSRAFESALHGPSGWGDFLGVAPMSVNVYYRKPSPRSRAAKLARQRPAVTGSQGPLGADAGPELSDDGAKN